MSGRFLRAGADHRRPSITPPPPPPPPLPSDRNATERLRTGARQEQSKGDRGLLAALFVGTLGTKLTLMCNAKAAFVLFRGKQAVGVVLEKNMALAGHITGQNR